MYTTLNQIRKHDDPCTEGWRKLLHSLGKTTADDEPLSLLTILDSNGLDDALWYFRAVPGYEKEKRLFAVWCARRVQHLMADPRSLEALDVAERFANGLATFEELEEARKAARVAAEEAAWAAAAWPAADAADAADAAADAADAAAWAAADAAEADAAARAARAARAALPTRAAQKEERLVQESHLREVLTWLR